VYFHFFAVCYIWTIFQELPKGERLGGGGRIRPQREQHYFLLLTGENFCNFSTIKGILILLQLRPQRADKYVTWEEFYRLWNLRDNPIPTQFLVPSYFKTIWGGQDWLEIGLSYRPKLSSNSSQSSDTPPFSLPITFKVWIMWHIFHIK
jgi:hypothetical protein